VGHPRIIAAGAQDTSFGRGLKVGTQAVGKGLADIAGMPVDLTTIALNAGAATANLAGKGIEAATGKDLPEVPYIQKPFLGSDSIFNMVSRLSEFVGYDVLEPEEMAKLLPSLSTISLPSQGQPDVSSLSETGTAALSAFAIETMAVASPSCW
jgi:hypothetical protein